MVCLLLPLLLLLLLARGMRRLCLSHLLLQVSGEEYGEEELDPEWATLLAELDTRLQVGAGVAGQSRRMVAAGVGLYVGVCSCCLPAGTAACRVHACCHSHMPSLCLPPQPCHMPAATANACSDQSAPHPLIQAAGRPRLSSRERAVAIRSLIVATASQSAEAALGKALADVEAFRCCRCLAPGRGGGWYVSRGAAILRSVAVSSNAALALMGS